MTPEAPVPAPATLPDEALVERFWAGREDALAEILQRYRALVRAKARCYFLVGGDPEDLVQEGMIGLYKAVRDYDGGQASFRVFAELCVTRQMLTAIRAATRQKHGPLNSSVSLHAPLPDSPGNGEHPALLDAFPGTAEDPAMRVVTTEEFRQLRAALSERLSALENAVLCRFVAGHTYQEIADDLQRHTKAIDNAVQRIRRKIGGYLDERREKESA